MTRAMGLGTVLTLMLCLSSGLFGQDTKQSTKTKGTLPANWGKLGLTDEQKQKIYSIQGKYQAEISELDGKIKELRRKRDTEMASVLTDGQKTRLKELASSRVPGSEDKGGEAKKSGDKKDKGPGDK